MNLKRIITLIIVVLMCFMFCSCSNNNKPKIEQIKSICELSTLECYYNNVAKSVKEAGDGLTHIFEKDREFWIEYEGVAKIGIDMELVSIEIEKDTVIVTIPHAELLSTGINEDEFNKESYIISNDSILNKNKITTEEQKKAIEKAQEKMKETINSNKALFEQAEEEAKKLIENYIKKIGDFSGKNIV